MLAEEGPWAPCGAPLFPGGGHGGGGVPPQGAETHTRHPPGRGEGARAHLLLVKMRVDRACCLHGEDGSHLVQGSDQDPDLTDAGREQQGPRRLPVGFAVAEDLGAKGESGASGL